MRPETPNGFILLEVLVAISLILGAWMASVSAYEVLSRQLMQKENIRVQLRQAFDAYEMAEQARANSNQAVSNKNISKGLLNESSRMSSRNNSLRSTVKSAPSN